VSDSSGVGASAGAGGRRCWGAGVAIGVAAVVVQSALGSTSSRAGAIDTPAIRRAVTIAEPSVVYILVRITGSLLDSRDGLVHGPLQASSKGTGWFVNPGGAIVTATHVVAPGDDDVKVALVDRYIVSLTGTQLATTSSGFAAYMAATAVHDVSFSIRVITQGMVVPRTPTDDDLFRVGRPALVLASSSQTSTDISVIGVTGHDEPASLLAAPPPPPVGAAVGIIGYPRMAPLFSVTPTYTYGPVVFVGHGSASTGLPSDSTTAGVASDATVVGTDAFAEHGDSGGPAVDDQGRVIGLVSFGAVTGRPIFLVSAADIDMVLADAHQANALGPADQQWRAGLTEYDAADLTRALNDFRACAAASADNSGCRVWAARLAATKVATPAPPLLPLTLGAALAVVLAALVLRRRRRTTAQR